MPPRTNKKQPRRPAAAPSTPESTPLAGPVVSDEASPVQRAIEQAAEPWWRSAWIPIVAAFLLFARTLSFGLVYDDALYITENPGVQTTLGIIENFWSTFPRHRPDYGQYRPITAISFTLEYAASGLEPSAFRTDKLWPKPLLFHLTNVSLHVVVTWLVYLLALRVESAFSLRRVGLLAPVAALLFAVHPVHTEVVSNATGRSELFAALFYVAALLAWDDWLLFTGRCSMAPSPEAHRLRYGAMARCLALFLAAMCGKESAITFPLVAGWWLLMRRDVIAPGKSMEGWLRAAWSALAPVGAAALAYMCVRLWVVKEVGMVKEWQFFERNRDIARAPVMAFLPLFYLKLLAIPVEYYPNYYTPLNFLGLRVSSLTSMASIWPVTGLLVWIGVGGAMIVGTIKRSAWAVGIGLTVLPLLVSLHFLPFGDFAADRFCYLPSVGFCILLGVGIERLAMTKGAEIARGIAAVIVVMFVLSTIAHQGIWKDPWSFVAGMMTRPNNPRALSAGAFQHLETAMGLSVAVRKLPKTPEGDAAAADIKQRISEQATKALEYLVPLTRDHPTFDLGSTMIAQASTMVNPPRLEEARGYLQRLLDERFSDVSHVAEFLYRQLAELEGAEKHWPEAKRLLEHAFRFRFKPGSEDENKAMKLYAEANAQLGQEAARRGAFKEAIPLLIAAVNAQPTNSLIRATLAEAYERDGDWNAAAGQWNQLLILRPNDPDITARLAKAKQRAAEVAASTAPKP